MDKLLTTVGVRRSRLPAAAWLPRANAHVALVGILTLAAVLRFAFLGDHSLWLDELFSVTYAKLRPGDLLSLVSRQDDHPPLYYLLLSFWIPVTGESEFAIRSLSVVFGLFAVAATYGLGCLLFNRRVALGAALLFGVAKFAIYYSQEARMYSLLMFLAPLSAAFFWRVIHEPRPFNLAGYVLSTVLLLYTQSYGLFILAAENVYLLVIWLFGMRDSLRVGPRYWIGAQCAVGALFFPWALVLLGRVAKLSTEGFWVTRPTLATIAGTFSEFSSNGHLLRLVFVSLLLIAATRLIIELAPRLGRSRPAVEVDSASLRARLFLFLCLLSPVLLPFAASQVSTPIYVTRAVGVGYFAFGLLIAEQLSRLRYSFAVLGAAMVIVGLSVAALIVPGYAHAGAYRFRELAAFVARQSPSDAMVILCGDDTLDGPVSYYAAKDGIRNRVREINDTDLPRGIGVLDGQRSQVWLVELVDRAESMQRCKATPAWLERRYGPGIRLPAPGFGFAVLAFGGRTSR